MASVMQSPSASNGRAAGSARRTKSASAFRTISEVADELDVAQHVLRFWESKFPQVRPLKRGGGRRYYRPEDVDLLRRIRSLLYDEGYTIKGAQKLLKGQRRPPSERPVRDNRGDTTTVEEDETEVASPALGIGLESEQKRALAAVRSELAALRDSLKKLTT